MVWDPPGQLDEGERSSLRKMGRCCDLTAFFGKLRLHAGARTGVQSNNQQSHQNCADQHDNPDVEAGMKRLVTGSGSEQS